MADWISFWNGTHPIYVSARHRAVHYERIAADLAGHVPHSAARVLDYGCGEALAADRMAQHCGRLVLCDAAPAVREKVAARFAGDPRIDVLSPDAVAALPDGGFDLIILNSVAQYLSRDLLADLLVLWRRLLADDGVLLLADVIPPDVSAAADAAALLGLGWREGFFLDAVAGLARTAVSPYRKLRAELGLTTYTQDEMQALLAAAGLDGRRVTPNVGHNQRRMAFQARRAG